VGVAEGGTLIGDNLLVKSKVSWILGFHVLRWTVDFYP